MDTPKNSIITFQGMTFSNRLLRSMKMPAIFVAVLTILMYASSKSPIALVIGILMFLFYFSEHKRWCKIYITNINKTADGKLNIAYLDKDQVKELTADIKSLAIAKKFVWYKVRGRVPYLDIKEISGLQIKQYDIGDWDEKAIDKVKNDLLQEAALQPTVCL